MIIDTKHAPKLSVPMYRQYPLVIYCSFPMLPFKPEDGTVNGDTIEKQTKSDG